MVCSLTALSSASGMVLVKLCVQWEPVMVRRVLPPARIAGRAFNRGCDCSKT